MKTSSSIDCKQLKGFIPFDYLTTACIEDLTNQFRQHTLEKGKILVKRGSKDSEDNYLALDNSSRIYRTSAITTFQCKFYSINRDYLDLVTTWSQPSEELEEQDPTVEDSDALDWMDALLNSPLFTRIPPANIKKLLTRKP
ncbi:MAG: hypothetical protein ACI9EX_001789 [Oleispira sp.]|jgi:hypothetical protein